MTKENDILLKPQYNQTWKLDFKLLAKTYGLGYKALFLLSLSPS